MMSISDGEANDRDSIEANAEKSASNMASEIEKQQLYDEDRLTCAQTFFSVLKGFTTSGMLNVPLIA